MSDAVLNRADLEGLEQLLSRLSRMAADLPQLAEVDSQPRARDHGRRLRARRAGAAGAAHARPRTPVCADSAESPRRNQR